MEKKQPAVEWWGEAEEWWGEQRRRGRWGRKAWWVGVGGGEMDVGPTVGVGTEKRL
jgi:hypothetical protein